MEVVIIPFNYDQLSESERKTIVPICIASVDRHGNPIAPIWFEKGVAPVQLQLRSLVRFKLGDVQLGRVFFGDLELFEGVPVFADFAEEFVQPHNDVLFRSGFRQSFQAVERVAHGLPAGHHRMDEHVSTMASKESEDLVLQDVVTQRHEGGRSRIHDEHTVTVADLLDKYVKLLLVDRSAPENLQMLGFKQPVLSERRVDRIGVQAVHGADFARKYWARIAEKKLFRTPPFPCSTM